MIVVGLLSSQKEAEEIRFIAKIFSLENRIHQIARKEAIRRLIEQHDQKCDQ